MGIENYLEEPSTTSEDLVELAAALVKLARLHEKTQLEPLIPEDITFSELRIIKNILENREDYTEDLSSSLNKIFSDERISVN